jgi:hypothetical protein
MTFVSQAELPQGAALTQGDAMLYGLFGVQLSTDLRLRSYLSPASGTPDLHVEISDRAPAGWAGPAVKAVEAGSGRVPGYYYHERVNGVDAVILPGVADWYYGDDRVICHLRDRRYSSRMEIFLLGTGLAYWLELRGMLALHAAAVEVGGRAIGFLATNRGGKSTLAVAMMQAGHALLTDDVMAVEASRGGFMARPSYPQLRLWPAQAGALLGDVSGLEFVHPWIRKFRVPVGLRFGTFATGARPLAAIYLPERLSDPAADIEISPLSSGEALREVQAGSFIPMLAETAWGGPRRLIHLAALLRSTPVRRISYPEGVEHLPAVCDALTEDARSLNPFAPANHRPPESPLPQ